MKKLVSIVAISMMIMPAFALTSAGQGRRAMSSQMAAAPRKTASTNQISAASMSVSAANSALNNKSSVRVEATDAPEKKVDMREKEKAACINNNIGIGNTFVWASRYSNVNNYESMIEDLENPENNTCFVKVDLKSNDSRISVADVPAKYFEMGRDITCGQWADEGVIKQRILDAKKSARTWATVGGVVGSAGIGVGAMELFGNSLIGGKVEGQYNKKLSENELLRSQLLVLAKEDKVEYNKFVRYLSDMQKACEDSVWKDHNDQRPDECEDWDFEYLLSADKN